MKLSQFKYTLPENLIANYPSEQRDECRLMVLDRKTRTIEHKIFKDILGVFGNKDVMITNNTKVFPARLYGSKEKTSDEIMLLFEEIHSLGNTIIVVTHEESIANRAKRIIRLKDGLVESDQENLLHAVQ